MPDRQLSSRAVDFIDDDALNALLLTDEPDEALLRDILQKSLAHQPLSLSETATLLAVTRPEQVEMLLGAAHDLKQDVYGNRIVIFAPLYIGSSCRNDCLYCAFRRSNKEALRRTLSPEELQQQVLALEEKGHKRLVLVWGESSRYDADFIAECIRQVYATRTADGKGAIRRVSINAAPLSIDGYRKVSAEGIGTYQIFQETYHHPTYHKMHPAGDSKADYLWRLDGLNRAMEGGCDDVGIGALFGLYDWRFEVLGLVAHAGHLMSTYGSGPHTISFPRLRPASGVDLSDEYIVNDDEFKRLVAILRLAIPYAGMVLTAREDPEVRRQVIPLGVSQIDAGSKIELGGYTEHNEIQSLTKEQFSLGDSRALDTVLHELIDNGYVPSFCTACYRLGRTGEDFMDLAIPGAIQRLCTPNALSTLTEYATDYASPETAAAIDARIGCELANMPGSRRKQQLTERLETIKTTDQRDLYI